MRMISGLTMAAILGALGWASVLWTGYGIHNSAGIRRHLLWSLAITLWNLFIQSLLLFMWISLTRQIREFCGKTERRHGLVSNILRIRNRLFPWITGSLVALMFPMVSGMSLATGTWSAAWTRSPTVHNWVAWVITAYLFVLVASETWGSAVLIQTIRNVSDVVRKEGPKSITKEKEQPGSTS